jgi:hypothetical protein
MEERAERTERTLIAIRSILDATLPHLTTKAERAAARFEPRVALSDKPGNTDMSCILVAHAGGAANRLFLRPVSAAWAP